MASRIIHLAIANILSGKYEFKDINRLKIGVTLPDAAAVGKSTEGSHLKIQICGRTKKTYDLTRFMISILLDLRVFMRRCKEIMNPIGRAACSFSRRRRRMIL